jgi:hypothetical protein
MIRNYFLLTAVVLAGVSALSAEEKAPAPFNKAIVTEVVNQVELVDPSTLQGQAVEQDAVLNAPDLLRTGRRSRAQLTAEDGTVARVGANTVFSFEQDSRTINLQQGSILFNSPSGQGGGNIVTNAASASVLGTTIIVAATNNGGFKVLVMEGSAQVTFPNGVVQTLNPGQMSFVLPGGQPGPVVNFDLAKQTEGSDLLNGFSVALPSNEIIQLSVQSQQQEIEAGNLVETGLVVIGAVDRENLILIETNNMTDLNTTVNNESRSGGAVVDPRLRNALTVPLVIGDESDIPSENIFIQPVLVTREILIELGISPLLIEDDRLNYFIGVAGESIAFFQEDAYYLAVDLVQFDESAARFDEAVTFLGKDFILFENFTEFYGLNQANELGFVSNGTIYFNSGSGLSVYFGENMISGDLFLESLYGVLAEQAFIFNDYGNILMVAYDGSLVFDGSFVFAGSMGYGASAFGEEGGYYDYTSRFGRVEMYAKQDFSGVDSAFYAVDGGIYIEAGEIFGQRSYFFAATSFFDQGFFVASSDGDNDGFNFLGIQLVAGNDGYIQIDETVFISESGYILFDAEGSIDLLNSNIINVSSLDSRIIMDAENILTISDSEVFASNSGSISLKGNAILLNNTTLSAARFDSSEPEARVILAAMDAIETYDSSIFSNIINIQAGNLVQLTNTEVGEFFNQTSSINIAARTVVLENVILRSNGEAASVVLSSQQGRLNVTGTSSGVLPGHVNYINTQYEGGSYSLQPAQNVTYDPISNVGGGNSASPIHVRQL